MAVPVIMPKFEMSQESATIVEWLKGEGDPVERGEPVLIVETDKITMEVESPATGFLAGIRGEPNQVVPVTEIIAYVLQPGETLPSSSEAKVGATLRSGLQVAPTDWQTAQVRDQDLLAATPTTTGWRAPKVDVEGTPEQIVARQPMVPAGKLRATPAARRLAREQGTELASVTGSGPQGRVQAADVAAYALITDMAGAPATAGAAAQAIEVAPISGIRRAIAQRMVASHQATARVTLVTEADATSLVEARVQLEATVSGVWGFAPGYNDLLALIVARALREFPYMNARLSADGQSIERLPSVNLGMAVDTEPGPLVPVIRDADRKGLRAIATELRTLVERARVGKSLPEELSGGTFTVTNLGMVDVDAFTPLINLPEAAVLGVGRIQPKAVVRDGKITVRQMWTLSLAFDHRLVDGAPAARFVQRIRQLIENPFLLLG